MINDSFRMFVKRGNKITSKLILEILSFYREEKRGCVIINMRMLVGLMYKNYQKNYASNCKKNIYKELENLSNFEYVFDGEKERLFERIDIYDDGLIIIHINEIHINYILYIKSRPLDEKTGYFIIDTSELNRFESKSFYIPIWLEVLRFTNNNFTMNKIVLRSLYERIGIVSQKKYKYFNYRILKPAIAYILTITSSLSCDIDKIKLNYGAIDLVITRNGQVIDDNKA